MNTSIFVTEKKRPQPEVYDLESRSTVGLLTVTVEDGKISPFKIQEGYGYGGGNLVRVAPDRIDDLIIRLTELRDRARHIAHEFSAKTPD